MGTRRSSGRSTRQVSSSTRIFTLAILSFLHTLSWGLLAVADAYKVFVLLTEPNVVSYTAVISAFAKTGRECEAVELFFRMRDFGVEVNEFTFVAILTACARDWNLELGFQIHALVAKMGFLDCVFVPNVLMGLYNKSGDMACVMEVF
ncbi:hypothetical protein QQ045_022829 [Rhodiola kirilowii]